MLLDANMEVILINVFIPIGLRLVMRFPTESPR